MSLAVFQTIGPLELLIVLGIVLVIFGPKRLPGLGRQLGAGMREFKDSITRKSATLTTRRRRRHPPAGDRRTRPTRGGSGHEAGLRRRRLRAALGAAADGEHPPADPA